MDPLHSVHYPCISSLGWSYGAVAERKKQKSNSTPRVKFQNKVNNGNGAGGIVIPIANSHNTVIIIKLRKHITLMAAKLNQEIIAPAAAAAAPVESSHLAVPPFAAHVDLASEGGMA